MLLCHRATLVPLPIWQPCMLYLENREQHPPPPSTIATTILVKSRAAPPPPVNNRDHHPMSKIASSTPPPPVNNLVATSSLFWPHPGHPTRKIPGYATALCPKLEHFWTAVFSFSQRSLRLHYDRSTLGYTRDIREHWEPTECAAPPSILLVSSVEKNLFSSIGKKRRQLLFKAWLTALTDTLHLEIICYSLSGRLETSKGCGNQLSLSWNRM